MSSVPQLDSPPIPLAAPAQAPQPWPVPAEPKSGRWLALAILLTFTLLFGWVLFQYFTGAHYGTDQNGYLMTARNILENHKLYFVPESPFQFAGRMCIMTADTPYRIYAKYPFGFPLLAALGRFLAGPEGMYYINPLCTILACFFSYFLFRTALTRFTSLIGALWLAVNPLTLTYANDSNSHASSLFCVTVGFWLLLRWWQTNSWWRGLLGGLALGYACTIRYSEFLLVIPVVFAALANLRWNWKSVRSCGALLLGWGLPVGVLAVVCWISFGAPWKTGYSYCREDTGFGWKYFIGEADTLTNSLKQGNWATLLTQLNHIGLFVMWPFSLVGLIALLDKSWRLGVTLALWALPSTFLYMFYYWAPQGEATVGYLRFFLTVLPAFIFAGLWVIERAMQAVQGSKWASLSGITVFGLGTAAWIVAYFTPGEDDPPAKWRFAAAAVPVILVGLIWIFERRQASAKVSLGLGLAALTALGCGINLFNILPSLERQQTTNVGLRQTVDMVKALTAEWHGSPVLFADEQRCDELDAIGGYQLFNLNLFVSPQSFDQYKKNYESKNGKDPNGDEIPDPLQHERAKFYMELLGKKPEDPVKKDKDPAKKDEPTWAAQSREELRQKELEIIGGALREGRRVGVLIATDLPTGARMSAPSKAGYVTKLVAQWKNQPAVSLAPGGIPNWGAGRPGRPVPARVAMATSWQFYEIMLEPAKKTVVGPGTAAAVAASAPAKSAVAATQAVKK